MIKKLIILAVIIMILMTFRMENAFDLNSGRLRMKCSLLGFTMYDKVNETPISQLKTQIFPGAVAEPNWYVIGGKKTEANQDNQPLPVEAIMKVATELNSSTLSPEQKKALLQKVWDSLKDRNFEAINQLKQQLETQAKPQ